MACDHKQVEKLVGSREAWRCVECGVPFGPLYAVLDRINSELIGPPQEFNGYKVRFDGYIPTSMDLRIVGRWIAWKRPEDGIVSVCGGTVQKMARGQEFNIDGIWCTAQDDPDKLRELRDKALEDLKEFIRCQ